MFILEYNNYILIMPDEDGIVSHGNVFETPLTAYASTLGKPLFSNNHGY